MKKQKLTPWFSAAEHKPVRDGVYPVYAGGIDGFSLWTGKQWHNIHASPEGAAASLMQSGFMSTRGAKWRGVAK